MKKLVLPVLLSLLFCFCSIPAAAEVLSDQEVVDELFSTDYGVAEVWAEYYRNDFKHIQGSICRALSRLNKAIATNDRFEYCMAKGDIEYYIRKGAKLMIEVRIFIEKHRA